MKEMILTNRNLLIQLTSLGDFFNGLIAVTSVETDKIKLLAIKDMQVFTEKCIFL